MAIRNRWLSSQSSGRPHRRIRGALPCLPVLLVALQLVTACSPEPPSDPELRLALGIEDSRPIHRIDLGGRGATEHIVPARLEIEPGDVVQFVVVDRRIHTVSFDEGRLPAAAAAFLSGTDQISSPPLIRRGSRFVVSFEDAPPGMYPFISQGNGDPTGGQIVVLGESR